MAPRADTISRAGHRVRREPLLPGTEGVDRTRARMLELIREGSKDPEVQDEARRAAFLARPHDYHGEIQAVWDYMTGLEAAPYRLDPVDAELLQGAAVPSRGRDCDCAVIKAGSLFEAIGHPVFVIIGARRAPRPGEPVRYNHTWLEVWCRSCGQVHSFDPVLDLLRPAERAQLGDVLPHAVTRRFPVSLSTLGYTEGAPRRARRRGGARPPPGLSGLGGFSLKKLAKGVAKVATSKVGGAILKKAISFVPGGSAALTAIDVASKGVKVINAVKKGGVGGLAKAAAPMLLDKVAPGLSAAVKSNPIARAVSTAAKAASPKPSTAKALKASTARTVSKPAAPKAVGVKPKTLIARAAAAAAASSAAAAQPTPVSVAPHPSSMQEEASAFVSPPEDAETFEPAAPEDDGASYEEASEDAVEPQGEESLDAGPFDDSSAAEEE
ncbi:hypothetical protein [Hyalangium versicolor]|uniref:hypothetical protein n=1 Tax=Hyalangium versicolor TaxID=2861190 RepID=UPI001CCD5302|nr:hypothetical protein [Hyalangium versicolor]